MADTFRKLTVILEYDYRDEELTPLIDAIARMRGVLQVERGEPTNGNDFMARAIAKQELRLKIMDVLT